MKALAGDRATPSPAPRQSQTRPHPWYQVGKASWYGGHFQGRKTANGEKFDMHELTCAHRSLPLGSWVRITNVHNHRSVFVRVNDRGPMLDDRIVDLSYAAARAVGISGLGRVKIEVLRPEDPEMAKQLTAQLKMPSPLIATGR
jgi:rare lipoprotein A